MVRWQALSGVFGFANLLPSGWQLKPTPHLCPLSLLMTIQANSGEEAPFSSPDCLVFIPPNPLFHCGLPFHSVHSSLIQSTFPDYLSGPVKNPSVNAGDMGSSLVREDSTCYWAILGKEQISQDGGGQALSPHASLSHPTFCRCRVCNSWDHLQHCVCASQCTCLATGHFCSVSSTWKASEAALWLCPLDQPWENTACLLLELLGRSGEDKRVCSCFGSLSFLSASLTAPRLPWLQWRVCMLRFSKTTTKPLSCNYWARVSQHPRACAPQEEKPLKWEAHTSQLENSPCSLQLEKNP